MLSPNISVTTAATDLTLLTVAERRAAVNISDGSRDVDLSRLESRVSAVIAQACKIATDGVTPPTLRKETITDTFRRNRWAGSARHRYRDDVDGGQAIYLSRRPVVSVASVVEAGTTLAVTSYEIRAGTGGLIRLNSDAPAQWAADKIVVVYDAGWDTVPDGLKRAAEQLMQVYWSQQANDPLVKQISIPGVLERQFWIGSSSDPAIPQNVMDALGPYMNLLV